MKHADKVIELMASYPGRPFVMRQITRYINPQAGCQERMAIKKSVQRVMVALVATGTVEIQPAKKFGSMSHYVWKTGT